MPTTLGPEFPPTFEGIPPRMSPEDLQIWRRWWPKHRHEAIRLFFDVGLGLPDELPQTQDANQLLGWIRNTQKRADVIIERADDVLLIELRFQAQLNALGRLTGYRLLLNDDNPFNKPIIPLLITDKPDSEVERLAIALTVAYDVV